MKPGKMRERITLTERTMQKDAYGRATPVWSVFAEVWAEVLDITGREDWSNERVLNEASFAVRVRYQSGILADMRIALDGTQFEIVQITNPMRRDKELIIAVREIQE